MENVSDEMLRQKLMEKGMKLGPITSTTRALYQKMYLEHLEDEITEINSPEVSPEKLTLDRLENTPTTRSSNRRTPNKRSPNNGKVAEATFTVPDGKKKKGIPTYCAPSLRRSTIERTAISRKLAEEACSKGVIKTGEPLKATGNYLQVTDTPLSIKDDADTKKSSVSRTTRGLGNTNKLNVQINEPGYMRATSSTLKKDAVPKTADSKAQSRMRRSIKLAKRRSIRTTQPTTAQLPKIGRSNIRKAKDSTGPASASRGGAGGGAGGISGKKKRAPWDTKGRLEDITNLYNEIKDQKSEVDEKLAELETEMSVKNDKLGELESENMDLKEALTTTSHELKTFQRRCEDQQFQLDEAILKKEELIKNLRKTEKENVALETDLTKTREELAGLKQGSLEQKMQLEEALMEKEKAIRNYQRIKDEVEEIEEDLKKAKTKLRESENQTDDLIRDLRQANNTKEETQDVLMKSKVYTGQLEKKVEDTKLELVQYTSESCATIAQRDDKITELEKALEQIKHDMGDTYNVLNRKETEIKTLKGEVSLLDKRIEDLSNNLEDRKRKIDALEGNLNEEQQTHRDVNRLLADRESQIQSLEKRVSSCTEKLHAGELLRRKLHNTIQELKGNIRVYCRVRPFLEKEVMQGQPVTEIPTMQFGKDSSGVIVTSLQGDKLGRKGEQLKNDFTFDHVFGPTHSQEDTFAEVAGLVQSSLDGYNVCIFAYGQTGSGKTHTMQGPIDPTSEHRGIIPRAMEQVFQTGEEMRDQGWNYEFTASFLEIYNENLHDLISEGAGDKIEIKLVNEKRREVEVTNVKNVIVTSSYDVHKLLNKANKNRTVAATKCNQRSSRSHSVYRLRIDGKNKNGESSIGYLNLVDLAGSERVADSGSTGQRLKEAQAINTSLSELGNVMMALQEKKTHIPYRNSKLTYLLCNSLGGNSKTLMFVNVSPLDKHTPETLNSLRFASKVNRVDLGSAKKN